MNILFYVFSAVVLFCGLLVITNRNPVNSAVFLVLLLFAMTGLLVLLRAFFLAAVQVLVYAGAIMVLFLFVIMLLNVHEEETQRPSLLGLQGSAFILAALLIAFFLLMGGASPAETGAAPVLAGTTEVIGRSLFSRFVLPLEVAGMILLVAMIGVVILSRPQKEPEKP